MQSHGFVPGGEKENILGVKFKTGFGDLVKPDQNWT